MPRNIGQEVAVAVCDSRNSFGSEQIPVVLYFADQAGAGGRNRKRKIKARNGAPDFDRSQTQLREFGDLGRLHQVHEQQLKQRIMAKASVWLKFFYQTEALAIILCFNCCSCTW